MSEEPVGVSEEEPPPCWEREELPGGIAAERRPEYVAFRHDSGDARIRIAPPNADLGREAHVLTLTLFPGTELSETRQLRSVTSERRAFDVAVSVMKLFDGAYEGPGTAEDAAAFAAERVRPADVVHDGLVRDDEAE